MNQTHRGRDGRPALEAFGAELMAADARLRERGPRPSLDGRVLAVIAAVALAVGTFLTLTPTGRAIAGDIGELVGIGDESTVSHAPGSGAPLATRQDPIVIKTGETPAGVPFEMVAFLGDAIQAPVVPAPGQGGQAAGEASRGGEHQASAEQATEPLCITLDFPDQQRPFGTAACTYGRSFGVPFGIPTINQASHAGSSVALQAEGMTGSGVARVSVSYQEPGAGRVEAPVVHGRIDSDLAARVGGGQGAGYYVAFLPAGVFPDDDADAMKSLRIVAYDDAGKAVKELDYGPIYERVHVGRLAVRCEERAADEIQQADTEAEFNRIRARCQAAAEGG